MVSTVAQNTVPVTLTHGVESTVDLQRVAVTILQVVNGINLDSVAVWAKVDGTYTRRPCVNIDTGQPYSAHDQIPTNEGDVFAFYTPGFNKLKILPAGNGQIDVTNIDCDGAAIFQAIAFPHQGRTDELIAQLNGTLEGLLTFLHDADADLKRLLN